MSIILNKNFRLFRFIYQYEIRRRSLPSFWLSFVIYNTTTTIQTSALFVVLHLFIDNVVDVFVVVYYSRSAHFVLAFVALADPRRCPALPTFRNLFVNNVALRFVVFLVVVLEVQLTRRARHFSTENNITIRFHLFYFSLLSLLSSNFSDCSQIILYFFDEESYLIEAVVFGSAVPNI